MSHKLFRLLESVYNTPHLIQAESLQPIVEYLQQRNINFSTIVPQAETVKEKKALLGSSIGEIVVSGTITYAPISGLCGPTGTSYQGILEQAEELIELGAKTIVMTFSSNGGAAAHCFTTCEELRLICDEAGVKLISYIDESAASAALALSVIADTVIIHPSASTGSVGCVCAVLDSSKALVNAGLKPIYISSTPGKTPFQDDGSFSANFLTELQENVTRLGNQFAEHVHKYTGVSIEEIQAMDAKMFHATDAVRVGLANTVMTHRQFAEYLQGINDA